MQTPTKKGRIFVEKKPHLMAIVLFLTGLICIGLLFGLSYKTYRKIDAVDQKMASVIKPVQKKQKSMKEDIELYTAKIEKKQAANKCLQQRAQTEKAVKNNTGEHERAPEAENSQKTTKHKLDISNQSLKKRPHQGPLSVYHSSRRSATLFPGNRRRCEKLLPKAGKE